MAIDTISTLPEIPVFGDPQFSSKMFALANALKAMVTELNTSNGQIDAIKLLIDTAKNAAETAATSAGNSESAAAQALTNVTEQVAIASQILAGLPDGTINDSTTTTTDTWSSSKLNTELGGKANQSTTYTKTEMDAALSGKQATLSSGTNIKTINGQSILGSGDMSIEVSPSTADVLNALAGASFGAVGTYCFAVYIGAQIPLANTRRGVSAAGSALLPAMLSTANSGYNASYYYIEPATELFVAAGSGAARLSGTWKLMSEGQNNSTNFNDYPTGLWLRVA